MSTITTEKELGEALKSNQNTIEIEGNLTQKVVRIRATGAVCWVVAIGAIGIAAAGVCLAPATGGVATVSSFAAAPLAVGVLGGATTVSSITIAVAAGGVGALSTLRKYKEISRDGNRIVLKRR